MEAMQVNDLVQQQTAMPICRVHVYSDTKDPKVPYHWAGREPKGTERPSAVLGVGGWEGDPSNQSRWQVLSARTNETRQWSCSSAQFQLAHPMSAIDLPRLPPVRPNDLVVIEMGYIKGLQTRVNKADGNTDYGNFSGDVVFYGKVDEVKDRGGSGESDGMVFTVSARCMMSYLVGNKIRCHYLPEHKDVTVNRAYIVRDLVLRGAAVEYVQWENDSIDIGRRKPVLDAKTQMVKPAGFHPGNCYLNFGKLELSGREDLKPPKGGTPGIVIMDRFPLDLIKHFSLVETEPRELWADRRTGEIHWQARRTDARRLMQAGSSHFRQYFYRKPDARANILSYTNEWTTLGTVTHFTMTNPLAANSNSKESAQVYGESPTALLVDPHTGKPLRRMTANRFVYDDTLVTAESSNAKAETILTALFTIWGRAIETGMVMIPGDPTLEIGEAVQIFNTALFGRRYWPTSKGLSNGSEGKVKDPRTQRKPAEGGGYADDEYNPEGVYRVEAVTNLFALGGVSRGYTTVFIFGPADPPTVLTTRSAPRLIVNDTDLAKMEWIDVNALQNDAEGSLP